jgi:hypothetical protein
MRKTSELQTHEPIPVTIVTAGNITGPEPPLDETWSDLDKLRWHAGVLQARTGLHLKITTGGYQINGQTIRNRYGWSMLAAGGGGSYDFNEMWTYINGIERGCKAYRLHQSTKETAS